MEQKLTQIYLTRLINLIKEDSNSQTYKSLKINLNKRIIDFALENNLYYSKEDLSDGIGMFMEYYQGAEVYLSSPYIYRIYDLNLKNSSIHKIIEMMSIKNKYLPILETTIMGFCHKGCVVREINTLYLKSDIDELLEKINLRKLLNRKLNRKHKAYLKQISSDLFAFRHPEEVKKDNLLKKCKKECNISRYAKKECNAKRDRKKECNARRDRKKELKSLSVLEAIKLFKILLDKGYQNLRWFSGCQERGEEKSFTCFITYRDNIVQEDNSIKIINTHLGLEINSSPYYSNRDMDGFADFITKTYPNLLSKVKGEDELFTEWFQQLYLCAIEMGNPIYIGYLYGKMNGEISFDNAREKKITIPLSSFKILFWNINSNCIINQQFPTLISSLKADIAQIQFFKRSAHNKYSLKKYYDLFSYTVGLKERLIVYFNDQCIVKKIYSPHHEYIGFALGAETYLPTFKIKVWNLIWPSKSLKDKKIDLIRREFKTDFRSILYYDGNQIIYISCLKYEFLTNIKPKFKKSKFNMIYEKALDNGIFESIWISGSLTENIFEINRYDLGSNNNLSQGSPVIVKIKLPQVY